MKQNIMIFALQETRHTDGKLSLRLATEYLREKRGKG